MYKWAKYYEKWRPQEDEEREERARTCQKFEDRETYIDKDAIGKREKQQIVNV